MKTIASFTSGRDNNFNLIRFLAAWLVIVAHSYTLNGDEWSRLTAFKVLGIDPGAFAVDVFFITSGFLIAMSFLRQGSPITYLEARITRIYPGLIVAVLFSAFVVGPLFTVRSLSVYFGDRTLYDYILTDSALILHRTQLAYELPAVFLNNPNPVVVNGSLWTLPYEIWMYILLIPIGMTGVLSRRKWFNFFYALFIVEFFVTGQLFSSLGVVQILFLYQKFAAFFLTGTFFYVNKDFIPLNWYTPLLSALLAIALHNTVVLPVIRLFNLAYGVFWCAFIPSGVIRRFNKLGDYSYGLYIYAFPIQQALIASLPEISSLIVLVLSSLITLFFAVLSWHLVEKPALMYKGFLYRKIVLWTERYPALRRFAS